MTSGRFAWGVYGARSVCQLDHEGRPIAGTMRFCANADEAAAFAAHNGEVAPRAASLGDLVRARKMDRAKATASVEAALFPSTPRQGPNRNLRAPVETKPPEVGEGIGSLHRRQKRPFNRVYVT